MAKSEKPRQGKSSRLLNLALVTLFTAASLWAADLAFEYYERTRLVPQMPETDATDPINLSALRYNDGQIERKTADGEFRILSFGDSFTYSVMDPQWSYNGVLQQRLDQAVDEYRFRVVNLGEPATGNRHFRAAYEFWSQVLEHDGVLFHIFLGNDVLDDAYLYASVEWAPNAAVLKGGNPVLDAGNRRVPRKYPLRMLDYAFAYWMSGKTRSEQDLPEGYNWAALTSFDQETFLAINFKFMENFDPQKLPDLLPGYEQVYLLLIKAQQIIESGMPVAIAIGPSEPQVDDGLREAVLAANGAAAGSYDLGLPVRIIERLRDRFAPDVKLVDLTGAFLEVREQRGEKLYFRRNTHWDREGNRLAGEVIAGHLLQDWFGREGATVPVNQQVHGDAALLGIAQIDSYLEPVVGRAGRPGPVVTGAVRSVHLFDGITGRPDNWAIAALQKPVLVEFDEPRVHTALRLHLYHADGRQYRFVVEALQGGTWRTVADHSQNAVGGIREIELGAEPVSAIRVTGLHNSSQENNPANAYLHIEELELVD
jgi:hypothetical protein